MLAELLNTIAIFLAGSKSHKGWLVGSVCQYRGVTMVLVIDRILLCQFCCTPPFPSSILVKSWDHETCLSLMSVVGRVVETIRSTEVFEDTSPLKIARCLLWYVQIYRREHRFDFSRSTETVDTCRASRIVCDIDRGFNKLPDPYTYKGCNCGHTVNR